MTIDTFLKELREGGVPEDLEPLELVYMIDKLRRLLRAACSTLESQHVPKEMWSGELVRWHADDLRGKI